MRVEITRHGDDLDICIDTECIVVLEHYRRPRLFTIQPMRSVFTKRRTTHLHLQHQLHMLTGWLSMALHVDEILEAAKRLRVGESAEAEI